MSPLRVCVIGAGPSGLTTLNVFAKAVDEGISIPDIVCYEQQSTYGGLWNLTWRTGVDEKGRPLHQSMYPHLWNNAPKECLEFPDYTFEQHFGAVVPSFLPRAVIRAYLTGFVNSTTTDVQSWIQCNTRVESVVYDPISKQFTVTVEKDDQWTVETFDYVICATGHFSVPNFPTYPGFETFPGRILHAHDFREAAEFKGKTVLTLGGSFSAEDIASTCYKYGAKELVCSVRTMGMGYEWPENFTVVPGLERVEGSTCYFTDGTSVSDVDAIILCTGYKHSFPFLAPELRLTTANRLWVDMLYDGIVLPSNPQMLYLGMQNQWFSFPMFQAQSYYVRDLILGRFKVPSKETMEAAHAEWRKEELALAPTACKWNFRGSTLII